MIGTGPGVFDIAVRQMTAAPPAPVQTFERSLALEEDNAFLWLWEDGSAIQWPEGAFTDQGTPANV